MNINFEELVNQLQKQLIELLEEADDDFRESLSSRVSQLAVVNAQMFVDGLNKVDNTDNVNAVKAIVFNSMITSRLKAKTFVEKVQKLLVDAAKNVCIAIITDKLSSAIKNAAS
jgi:hypothetical protein